MTITAITGGGPLRRIMAVAIGVVLSLFGLAGVGDAQQAVQIQGVIEAVDCQAQTVVLSAPTGANTVAAAAYTVVLINSTSVPFCTLQAYIGAPATAWLVATGNQFTATRIDVTGPATSPSPADVTAGVSPVPIWGVVLGTIVVVGLVYLLVHGPDGGYYRYPYYGEYYRRYYRPEYRPYTEAYPATAAIITVAPAIAGTVLGIVIIDNLQYVLSRDAGGHLYRYPYYGPYRQVYYRPTYRQYQGPYVRAGDDRRAPVRQGDPRWDAPAKAIHPAAGAPRPAPVPLRPTPGPQPIPVRPPTPTPTPLRPTPGPQPVPVRPPTPNPAYQLAAPQRPPAPAYQPPPQRPPAPAYQPPPQRPPIPAYQPPAPVFQPRIPQRPAGPGCGGPNQPPCPGGGTPIAPPPARQPPARR